MSDKDLDKLFKDKLGKMEVTPSDSTWGRIEGKLRPRSFDRKFYWGIAASIAVVFTLGIMIGKNLGNKPQQPNLVQNQTVSDPELSSETNTETTAGVIDNLTEDNIQEEPNTNQTPFVAKAANREILPETSEEVVDATPENIQAKDIPFVLTEVNNIDLVSYKTVELNENKGLNTVNSESGIPFEEPKGLNVNKLLQMAKDLKSDNNSWAILREAKNELFSLNKKEEGAMD